MTILYDATKPRKPARKPFGRGLALTVPPPARKPARGYSRPSEADRAWATANLNATCTDYDVIGESDARLEGRAWAALSQARLDSGFHAF